MCASRRPSSSAHDPRKVVWCVVWCGDTSNMSSGESKSISPCVVLVGQCVLTRMAYPHRRPTMMSHLVPWIHPVPAPITTAAIVLSSPSSPSPKPQPPYLEPPYLTTIPQVRTYLLVGMSVALISLLAASLCGAQGGPLCHALCMGLGLGFGLVQAGAWPCALRVQVGERHCVYIRYIGCLDVC